MEARSGQNHDDKIAPQVKFNLTASNIMDLLHIFVINKQSQEITVTVKSI